MNIAPQDAAGRVEDKALKALLPAGVGFHHAALSGGDRALVEQLFIACDLLVRVTLTGEMLISNQLPARPDMGNFRWLGSD